MTDYLDRRAAPPWCTSFTIDGEEITGAGAALDVVGPATEETLCALPTASVSQVDGAVAAARRAFDDGRWSGLSGARRGKLLHAFADRIESLHDTLAAGVVCEVGSPVSLATTLHTDVALRVLRTYADLAAQDRTVDLGADGAPVPSRSIVAHRPMGVAAVITAYNIPLLILARAMGAALAAGCTTVVLPSPKAPLTSLIVARAAAEAGLPDGVVNIVVGGHEAGERLGTHPGVDKVAFTGSLGVGRRIMAQAVPRLTGLSLELGGKSPSLVMPGFDATEAAYEIHARYLRNGGQGCAAPARILVPRDYYDEFAELSRVALARIRTGDPWDPETIVGPMISREHRDGVRATVEAAVAGGATLVAEGPDPGRDTGWFVRPALVGGVAPEARIAQDEIFGPVGVVLPYNGIDDAVRLANGTAFGLSAHVYCRDKEDGVALAARLRAGTVAVNGGGAFRPDAPFGGFKASGFGREYGEWGVREFLEVQHVQWPAG
ncbi:aldehyde dehydrogenase family protein [Amycolatopsis acidicola]|uniref:Aldehyde dehydrogenase family protein n=1 Tax=Amycolatopsis acidicola TaxID=2596893 RepID=A0A5N0VPB6_9PSEU|nr:aldehyde dehydrogenase family protein [Amycolatopsis acidicola]KAA9166461.1 aldehyde dehydrogenase family protein [Amycolatopsis acidicola]